MKVQSKNKSKKIDQLNQEEDLKYDYKILTEYKKAGLNCETVCKVEDIISGKEYRFLVIGDKVVGILHRAPENATGDGERSIRELIEIKNQSPLRGKGYLH